MCHDGKMKALILALGEYWGYAAVNEKQGRKSVFLAAENEKRTAGTSRMQIILV